MMTGGRIIKLFDVDDNRWTIELKMKIEVERSALRKMENDLENMETQLASVRNNIAIVRRALDFLKSDEARIVIMAEYQSYKAAMPKLYRDETEVMNAITTCTSMIKGTVARINGMLLDVDRLKFRVLEFKVKS